MSLEGVGTYLFDEIFVSNEPAGGGEVIRSAFQLADAGPPAAAAAAPWGALGRRQAQLTKG